MTTIGMKGGDAFRAKLAEIGRKANDGDLLRLGFLENATYPDGTQVAYIAAIQEYGGSFEIKERQQTIYRKVNQDGSFASHGKFVKASKSNFATEHAVPAHTVTIPPRPFFRQMIAAKSPGWGATMAKAMKTNDYDAGKSLALMGEGIRGQLQASIRDFTTPPNAPSTIAQKGFDHPLIDTGVMLDSVDYDVTKDGD